MTILKPLATSLLVALSFSSCALESEKAAARAALAKEEAEAAKKAAAAEAALKPSTPAVVTPETPSTPKVAPPLDFADPDTTKELITAETTKTVTGPVVKQEDAPDTTNVIHVAPPTPADQLPEPATN